MKEKELKELLTKKKSYLKKGTNWLAEKYEIPAEKVRQILNELREETRTYRKDVQSDVKKPVRFSKYSFFKERMIPHEEVKKVDFGPSNSRIRTKHKGRNVLVIGDLHEPFTLDGYLEHCKAVYEEFGCNEVVFIGDMVDLHAVNYHEHDPDGLSPYDEYMRAVKKLKKWYEAFPKAKVCIGNHDALGIRKVFTAGLPSFWLKSLEQILEAPKDYEFALHHEIDGVFYTHGTGTSGDGAAMKIANQNRQPAVIGHLHSVSNIKYSASYKDLIFGMTVGCGINYKEYAFNYGKDNPAKPIITCGVVLGGKIPVLVPMEL